MRNAQRYPEKNFLGFEKCWQRIRKTLRRIDTHRVGNVRVMHLDAEVAFERLLKPMSVERIYCLFPCPWPKRTHVRHRLFNRDFFRLTNSRLVSGGEMKIVTDYAPYVSWIKEELDQTGYTFDFNTIQPQYDTKFERKWCEAGQAEFFEINLSKVDHIDVPVKNDEPLQGFCIDSFDVERFSFTNVTGPTSIILKDCIYDKLAQKAVIHILVAETTEHMTQHVWIGILRRGKDWKVDLLEGCEVIPTRGVQQVFKILQEALHVPGK